MKKNKNAFTLAELMLGIAMLVIIMGLLIPVVKRVLPDADKDRAKHAYYQIIYIIKSMNTDPYLYPTGRFDAPRDYNSQNGTAFSREEKFTKAFISKLNVMQLKELKPSQEWNSSKKYTGSVGWNRVFGFGDKKMEEQRDILGTNADKRTCVLTNNRVYYCLPTITFSEYAGEEGLSDEEKKAQNLQHDRFAEDGTVLISVYFSEDHSLQKGYFFTVNKYGKVALMPSDDVTCFNTSKNEEGGLVENCHCSNKKVYDEYNHCRLYEFLLYTN